MVTEIALKALVVAAVGFVAAEAALRAGVGMMDEFEKARTVLGGETYVWEHHRALVAVNALRLLCAAVALVALAVTAIAWAVGA